MRAHEYKFWHKKIKQMFDVISIDFQMKTCTIEKDKMRFIVPFSQGILLEYTGMIDKNGRKIFERDYYKKPVSPENICEHGNFRYMEIIYRNGMWIASYLRSEKGQILPRGWSATIFVSEDSYGGWHRDHILMDGRNQLYATEIIGSVLEKPELLLDETN